MKKITLSILFLASVCAYAQSFKLYEVVNFQEGGEIANGATLTYVCEAETRDGILCASKEVSIIFENTLNEDKLIFCEREIIQMVGNAYTDFCWGTCNPSSISIDEKVITANTKTEIFDGFIAHYGAPAVVGTSLVRYTFYDSAHLESAVSVVLEYITPPDLRIPAYNETVSLSAYPNPAVDYLTVETSDLPLKQASVTLYDAIGRRIKTHPVTSYSTKIDVENLEQGIYYLQFVNDNRTVNVRKFVKE